MAYDDQLDGGKRLPNSAEILSEAPRRDTYDKTHGSGNPNLQPGELQKIWHPADKPRKPKK